MEKGLVVICNGLFQESVAISSLCEVAHQCGWGSRELSADQDIAGLAEELAANPMPIVLIGWSYGGIRAQTLAAMLVNKGMGPRELILVATERRSQFRWLQRTLPLLQVAVIKWGFQATVGRIFPRLQPLLRQADERGVEHRQRMLSQASDYITAEGLRTKVPTTVVMPQDDSIVPLGRQRSLARFLGTTPVVVPDTDHFTVIRSKALQDILQSSLK